MYEKLKQMTKETILTSFNQAPELREVVEDELIHPDAYRPESVEIEKRNEQIEKESNELIRRVFSSISTVLASRGENKHLSEAQYGENVDVRAYWKRCGFGESKPRGAISPDTDVIRFQFEDKAAFQIKCDMPLAPVFDPKKAVDVQVPECGYAPAVYKIFANHILPMQTPGRFLFYSNSNLSNVY